MGCGSSTAAPAASTATNSAPAGTAKAATTAPATTAAVPTTAVAKPAAAGKIVLVGASGYIGKATVASLVKAVGGGRVTVATRNPTGEAGASFVASGANVVAGDFNSAASLEPTFTGASAVYIITPGTEDRAKLALNAVAAAKTAGVPYILVLSVSTAGDEATLFGRQFGELEAGVKASGIPYTLLRLPLFTDNNWAQAEAIAAAGKFYGPVNPTASFASVTVQDAAEAATAILSNPSKNVGKTYDIASAAYSNADLAAAFSASLGKPVEYVQVPYDTASASFIEKGWPAWQVGGIIELFKLIDNGTYVYPTSDFKALTGKEPMTTQAWVEANKFGFGFVGQAVVSAPAATAASSGKVVIVGASGYIGKATVAQLSAAIGGDKIVVATRNVDAPAADSFRAVGATVVAGDMNNADSLKAAFTGASAAYIIAPGTEDRATLSVNAINAAKTAGVPYILVLSVTSADDQSTLFGRQFGEVEAATKASDIPYTLLRLPLFTDNNWAQAESIKATGKFYGPVNPTASFASVTVQDAAEAATAILSNPSKNVGKTYDIASAAYSNADLAAAFSASLGKPVEYVQVPYEAASASFIEKGWPAWQVGGLIELFKLIDNGTYVYPTSDFKALTGKEPTTTQAWVEANKFGFGAA